MRHPFAAWFAALAIVLQLGTAALHPAMAGSPRQQAAAALSAAIGEDVSLCAKADDHPGAPTPGHSCDDDCPLCRIASHAAAILPGRAAPPLVLAKLVATVLIPRDNAPALAPIPFSNAQPRAPPVPV